MKFDDIKGVIGEKLPVSPTLMASIMKHKKKVAAVLASIAAILTYISNCLA